MSDEKLGIDNLKNGIEVLATVVAKVLKAMEDKKVSISEGLGLAFELPKVWKTAKSFPEIIAEVKDLDPEESQALLQLILEKYEEISGNDLP
jgi:hypothetical protein